ncbi:MAG: hypothetical protein EGP82_01935 [Odoribacter splanchnicus]|nr:hypothetical protein [Odoribacter splanchnicus]
MPIIEQINNIYITPEKFLRACSDLELKETLLLLNMKEFAGRIQLDDDDPVECQFRDIDRQLKQANHES